MNETGNLLKAGSGFSEVCVAEVDVRTSSVPVARKWFGVERRVDAVLLSNAVQQVPASRVYVTEIGPLHNTLSLEKLTAVSFNTQK